MIFSQRLLFGKKRTTQNRFDTEHGKESRGHTQPRHLLRFLLISAGRKIVTASGRIENGHALKRLALLLEIPEVRRGDDVPVIAAFAEGFPYEDQPRRIRERERF